MIPAATAAAATAGAAGALRVAAPGINFDAASLERLVERTQLRDAATVLRDVQAPQISPAR